MPILGLRIYMQVDYIPAAADELLYVEGGLEYLVYAVGRYYLSDSLFSSRTLAYSIQTKGSE